MFQHRGGWVVELSILSGRDQESLTDLRLYYFLKARPLIFFDRVVGLAHMARACINNERAL